MLTEIDREFSKNISDYLKYCDSKNIGEIDKHIGSISKAYIDNNGFDIISTVYTRNSKGIAPANLDIKIKYKNSTGETFTITSIVI